MSLRDVFSWLWTSEVAMLLILGLVVLVIYLVVSEFDGAF